MNEVFEWRDAPRADFAVIGNPVSHSLSPRMHSAIYRELGLDFRYVAIRADPGEVGVALDHLANLGYQGVNVTVPHKQEVLGWPDEIEPFAIEVQAANTVSLTRRSCINTDAPGFLETVRELPLGGNNALILGAGGSARALVAALVADGWKVTIFNRTRSRAEEIAEKYQINVFDSADPADADLILNTTSSAFDGEAPAVEWNRCKSGAIAYDLMYSKQGTPFLKMAENARLRTIDGLSLLVAQGALSFEWWTGKTAPRSAMMEAIRTG